MDSNPSPPKAIELAKVCLSLTSDAGVVEVLRGIDLSILASETVGIVGPSGSGKTSLLMVMAGLERADTGTVKVAGSDLGPLSEDQLAQFPAPSTIFTISQS